MIYKLHGHCSRMTDFLCHLMKMIVDACPIKNLHTEQMMEDWIIQLWKFQILVVERCVDHTCPQEVIIVEINKDLSTPLDWVEHHLTI